MIFHFNGSTSGFYPIIPSLPVVSLWLKVKIFQSFNDISNHRNLLFALSKIVITFVDSLFCLIDKFYLNSSNQLFNFYTGSANKERDFRPHRVHPVAQGPSGWRLGRCDSSLPRAEEGHSNAPLGGVVQVQPTRRIQGDRQGICQWLQDRREEVRRVRWLTDPSHPQQSALWEGEREFHFNFITTLPAPNMLLLLLLATRWSSFNVFFIFFFCYTKKNFFHGVDWISSLISTF